MKIGILIDRLNVGGVEKIAIEQVKALRALNIDASLVVLTRKSIVINALRDLLSDVPVIYLEDRLFSLLRFNFKIPFFYFFSFFHISYPLFLPFVINKKEFDLLISHNTYTTFTALSLRKIKKIPYLFIVWDPIYYILGKVYVSGPISLVRKILDPISRKIDSLLVNNAGEVITFGFSHKEYINKILKNKKKLHIMLQGIKTSDQFTVKSKKYLLSLTAWKRGKGIERLIKLMADIPKYKLHIVGVWLHKDYYEEIKQLVKKLRLTNRIYFNDNPTQSDIIKEYQNALVAIIINNEKGFGLPALEAAANGTTFIIPGDCGAAKLFTDKKDGFTYKYGDDKALLKLINKFTNNKELAYKMGRNAWNKTKDEYSWEKHALALIKLIKSNI